MYVARSSAAPLNLSLQPPSQASPDVSPIVAPCNGAPCNGILQYLERMIDFSRRHRRPDMESYYQEAWEFASIKIFGPLPPRKQDLLGTFYKPSNPEIPAGFRPPKTSWPLRKILKINEHPQGSAFAQWEMLDCGHELPRYPGYNNPVQSRRCIYCAVVAMATKSSTKKPSASAPCNGPIAEAKAVSA